MSNLQASLDQTINQHDAQLNDYTVSALAMGNRYVQFDFKSASFNGSVVGTRRKDALYSITLNDQERLVELI